MAANIEILIPELKSRVLELLGRCKDLGYEMRPLATVLDLKQIVSFGNISRGNRAKIRDN